MLVSKVILIGFVFGFAACSSTSKIGISGDSDKEIKQEARPPDEIFNIADIMVGKSTLDEVLRVFRGGAIQRSGDAGLSVSSVCYIGQDGTTLTFESGEMGGQSLIVTGAKLTTGNKLSSKKRCMKSTIISQKTAFKQGLGLSKTTQWVRDNLGSPTKYDSESLSYIYQSKSNDGVKNRDTQSTIELRISGGKVTEASVFQVSEYY